ncbi:MAG TPA: hypothetical protein VFZ65_19295 [Planctomycetota bacterium]|nr:hypothetical protein [Planctomycetota bacterium]
MRVDPWPIEDPPNFAVISLRSIVLAGGPILHVTCDQDDHSWQFLGAHDPEERDACVVCLRDMLAKAAFIAELSDLPHGWHARRQPEMPCML